MSIVDPDLLVALRKTGETIAGAVDRVAEAIDRLAGAIDDTIAERLAPAPIDDGSAIERKRLGELEELIRYRAQVRSEGGWSAHVAKSWDRDVAELLERLDVLRKRAAQNG